LAKRQSPFRSGAFRFAFAFATVFAVAAFLLLGMVRHQIGHYAHQATVGSLTTESAVLASEGVGHIEAAIERRTRAAPDGNFNYALFDASGRRLTGRIPENAAHAGWDQVVMREHDPTPNDPERPERLLTLGTRLPDGSLLVVATDGYDIDKLGHHMAHFTIVWAIAITLLALLAGWMAGRIFVARLDAANAAIERIMAGRTEQRLPRIGLAPELDDLGRNINRMLDRIDGLLEGLRQVSTDIAHDLRTPLTRLRQMLDVVRETSDREEIETGIDLAIAQTDHLLSTFRAILRLAQIEGGERRAPFQPVDIPALIASLMETYDPVASDAGHRLTATAPTEAMVSGDPELLAQLLANLIENAILHTPAGTAVRIEATRASGAITLSVSDNGPGVPQGERERIIRRFYQVDPSRTRGSSGLGLSIVNAIVNLHGARLSISDAEPGLRVTVTFPDALLEQRHA
jgi:signal transduction histidine kinase